MRKISILPTVTLFLCAAAAFGQRGLHPQISAPQSSVASSPGATQYESMLHGAGDRVTSASHHLTRTTNESWKNNAWRNSDRTSYAYDGSGYRMSSLQEVWDTVSGYWKKTGQGLITNDGGGRATQVISQVWVDSLQEWANSSRATFTYNGWNKVATLLGETWSGGAWVNNFRETDTYDDNGYLTNSLSELWGAGSGGWRRTQQTVYTNNTNGTVKQQVLQSMVDSTQSWADYYRVSYTYNASDKATEELTEIMAGANWLPYRKVTNTYDSKGYLTHSLEETRDFATGGWKSSTQSDYTNNGDGDQTLVVTQLWDVATSAWINRSRSTLEYDAVGGVDIARSAGSLDVYPNPGSGQFTLVMSDDQMRHGAVQVQVLNALGGTVLHSTITGPAIQIDLSAQPAGMYVVRVATGTAKSIAQKKVVVTGAK